MCYTKYRKTYAKEEMEMPAAYAHYVFGKKVYAMLPKREKELICEGKDAFLLGLHGPDLLVLLLSHRKESDQSAGDPDASVACG